MVICNTVINSIHFVKTHCGFEDMILNIVLDCGGRFFKIYLSVLENSKGLQRDVNRNQQSYKGGIGANKFKDSGLKKTLILAIEEDIQEISENVSLP